MEHRCASMAEQSGYSRVRNPLRESVSRERVAEAVSEDVPDPSLLADHRQSSADPIRIHLTASPEEK